MRIVVPGRDPAGPDPDKAWWAGRRFACANCPCEFVPEIGDAVIVTQSLTDTNVQVALIRCPSCQLGNRYRSDDPAEIDIDPFEPEPADQDQDQDQDGPECDG